MTERVPSEVEKTRFSSGKKTTFLENQPFLFQRRFGPPKSRKNQPEICQNALPNRSKSVSKKHIDFLLILVLFWASKVLQKTNKTDQKSIQNRSKSRNPLGIDSGSILDRFLIDFDRQKCAGPRFWTLRWLIFEPSASIFYSFSVRPKTSKEKMAGVSPCILTMGVPCKDPLWVQNLSNTLTINVPNLLGRRWSRKRVQ